MTERVRTDRRRPWPSRAVGSRARVALVTLAVVSGACSVATHEEAQPVEDAPEDLLVPPSTQAPLEDEPTTEVELVLYYTNAEGQLVRVTRMRQTTPTNQEVLDALVTNPEAEPDAELVASTQFPANIVTTAQPVENGTLTVVVEGGDPLMRVLIEENPPRVRQIYSQLVCTMVRGIPDSSIARVLLADAEGPIQVSITTEGEPYVGPVEPAQLNDCKTAADLAQEAAEETADEQTTTTANG